MNDSDRGSIAASLPRDTDVDELWKELRKIEDLKKLRSRLISCDKRTRREESLLAHVTAQLEQRDSSSVFVASKCVELVDSIILEKLDDKDYMEKVLMNLFDVKSSISLYLERVRKD